MKVLTPVLGACLLASSLALGVPATASAEDQPRVSAPGEWRGGGQYRGMREWFRWQSGDNGDVSALTRSRTRYAVRAKRPGPKTRS